MESELEVIDAFVDGERVDRDALMRALSGPAGREYLADLLELRECSSQLPFMPALVPRPIRRVLPARWALAASLLVCALGAYAVGHQVGRSSPLPPDRAAHLTDRAAPMTTQAVTAPAPTRIIRLEPGIDWIERPGGN